VNIELQGTKETVFAVCCHVLQCAAVCCSALQCNDIKGESTGLPGAKETVFAVCCCVLQRAAVCCSVLQCDEFEGENTGLQGAKEAGQSATSQKRIWQPSVAHVPCWRTASSMHA